MSIISFSCSQNIQVRIWFHFPDAGIVRGAVKQPLKMQSRSQIHPFCLKTFLSTILVSITKQYRTCCLLQHEVDFQRGACVCVCVCVLKRFYFLEQFRLTAKLSRKFFGEFPNIPCLHTGSLPHRQHLSTRVVYLLLSMNLYSHIIISQDQVRFIRAVVHSMDLHTCIMTCIPHYNIIQNIFTAKDLH